jgi:hypothetical protein
VSGKFAAVIERLSRRYVFDDASTTQAMAQCIEFIRNLEKELFVLMTARGDHAVRRACVAGRPGL